MTDGGIDLETELDRLYSLPAAEFVAARNELAKRLRSAGDRDAADRVKKLSKPSVTAWAVNQLAFRARSELEGLKAAGEQVRAAHLAGPREQQAAAKARRDAISNLRVIAEVALQEVGVTPGRSHRQRISQTLEVLSSQTAEEESQPAGRLSTDLEPAGFDALTDLAAALTASQKSRPAPKAKPAAPKSPVQAKPVEARSVAAKAAVARPAAAQPARPKPPKPKVVAHPAAKPQQNPAVRQAASRRQRLDRRRDETRSKLERLEERLADLNRRAEETAAELTEAKRAEAAAVEAALEAERLAREARARAESAARITAKARLDAESASAACGRLEAELTRARDGLAEAEAARARLSELQSPGETQ